MNWDLTSFYNGFDDPKYKKDLNNLKDLVEKYNKLVESINSLSELDFILKYIDIQEQLVILVRTLYSYNSLINATDVTNTKSLMNMSELSNILNKTTKSDVLVTRYFKNIDLDKLRKESNKVEENIFYLEKIKESSKYLLSEKEEVLYSKLKELSSSSWSQVQSLLTSNLLVDLGDKKITLTEARNLAYSNDADIRKNAYIKELESYEQIADITAIALSNIKREVTIMNELRGYKDAIEHTLSRSNMKKETLDAMISAMFDYIPDFERYFLAKAKYLNHENGLPFYDLFAPIGKLDKQYTYEEAQKIINDSFYGFSKKLGDYSKKAFESNWIDPFPKKGKRGGAFCSNQPQLKESRILSNFTGSLSDVSTLAHELGHGYHGEIISENSPLQWSYPMPLAETASIFCETIVTNYLLENLDCDLEKLSVLEISMQNDSQVIIDILSRYIFEQSLFEISNRPVSKDEMNKLMIDAQKKAYGKGLDENYLHPYMWINKGHYYSAGLNYYNFPYAFGLLFGKGLYAKYLENKDEFIKNYDKLLKLTTKASVEDVAMSMEIDVTKKDFWISSLELIKKDINTLVELMENK